jgi:hypothetical protein
VEAQEVAAVPSTLSALLVLPVKVSQAAMELPLAVVETTLRPVAVAALALLAETAFSA